MREADNDRSRRRAFLVGAVLVGTIIFAFGITALTGALMLFRWGAVAPDMLTIAAVVSALGGGACLTHWAWKNW